MTARERLLNIAQRATGPEMSVMINAGDLELALLAEAGQPVDANKIVANEWVKVTDRLPDPGKAVLLDIGERTPLRAMWTPAKRLAATADDSGEYDEATDTYWCIEGWYEWNREEEVHWLVSKPALNWCPLPAPPAPEALQVK